MPVKWMAAKIHERAETLAERISEAVEDLGKLRKSGNGSVEVRFGQQFYTHAYYLFESGGILALYSYRPNRAPSGAVMVPSGIFHKQCLEEFKYVYDSALAEPSS